MQSIYQIDQAITAWADENIDSETGEIHNIEALQQLQMDKLAQIDNLACYVKDLTADAAAIKTEEESLSERRKAKIKRADSIKEYLAITLNGEKYESARVSISYHKSTRTDVDDVLLLPYDLRRIIPERCEPNKDAIKDAIKHGREVPGARLVETNNIQIK